MPEKMYTQEEVDRLLKEQKQANTVTKKEVKKAIEEYENETFVKSVFLIGAIVYLLAGVILLAIDKTFANKNLFAIAFIILACADFLTFIFFKNKSSLFVFILFILNIPPLILFGFAIA